MTFDEMWKSLEEKDTTGKYKQAREMADLNIEQLEYAYNSGYAEWKVYGRQGGIPITDYCTNCKYEMKWYRTKYNFCPKCGAKMLNQADVE